MNTRNTIFIIIAFLLIAGTYLIIDRWQINQMILKNNELIISKLKNTINQQLVIKNTPIVDISGENQKGTTKIILTKDQINLINRNITLNTSRVDEAIVTFKEEVAKDISRESIYISILLAAVGICGVFFPIILNIYSTRDLEKRIAKTESQLDTAQILLDATEVISKNAETTAKQATETAKIATESTKTAIVKTEELSTIMYLLDILSKLKMLDFLRFNNNQITREEYMKSYFVKLKNSFEKCKTIGISPLKNIIFKESCIDFAITLYQLQVYVSANRELLNNLSSLITLLNNFIKADDLNIEASYDELIGILDRMGTGNLVVTVTVSEI